ncbi:MAG: GIY-YIG nuclease family protein [bacterium]
MVIEMIEGYKFSDPVKLADFKPKAEQGVYIIFYTDISGLKFCYIGSSGDISQRGFPFSHNKIDSMVRKAGSKRFLYISVHYMPNSSKADYLELERTLIDMYNPPCNKQ